MPSSAERDREPARPGAPSPTSSPRRTRRRRWACALVAVCAGLVGAACGTDAVGVDACRQVEAARCRAAHACGVDLTAPPHHDDDVTACIRFYDTACLHGLVTTTAPGAPATQACVAAIGTGDCTTVLHPETAAACAWLTPPATAAPADAGADAPAAATTDASADAPGG